MKRIIIIVLACFLLNSCEYKDAPAPLLGNAAFLPAVKTNQGGRITDAPMPAFAVVSIKDSKGAVVEENRKIPLFPFGVSYLSEPLSLKTGTYQLARFVVLDEAGKALYATPLEGSDLAKYVADACPIDFVISESNTTQVAPQVLVVSDTDTAESFGMVSLGFDVVKISRLLSEEFLMYDPANISNDGFVKSSKKVYTYEQNRLTRVDFYEYDSEKGLYDSGSKLEEYIYDPAGRLILKVNFLPESDIKWVHNYEYSADGTIRITRQEYHKNMAISEPDRSIMERKASMLTVKYYQSVDQQYAQIDYEFDDKGNVSSVMRTPSSSSGKLFYKYDQSPNPYYFPLLAGDFGVDTEKYLSVNNVIETTNGSEKTARIIQYNEDGYPASITSPASTRRILSYFKK